MVKCIVFGLDGASFNIILPLIEAGKLPAIEKILRNGGRARLHSVIPWQTPTAWTSYATGVNPGNHGVFGWWKPNSTMTQLESNSGPTVLPPRFWELFSVQGVRVGIVNVPMTFPARPVNGFMISGLDFPSNIQYREDLLSYPYDTLNILKESGIDYDIFPIQKDNENAVHRLNLWEIHESLHVESALQLAEKHNVEFLQINLFLTDYFSHRHGPNSEIVAKAYEIADKQIERVLNEINNEELTVFLVSDHGSCAIDRFIMIHNVLKKSDLLRFKNGLAEEHIETWKNITGSNEKNSVIANKMRSEGAAYTKRMYSEICEQAPGANIGFTNIDWNHTTAFCVSDYGQITVNRHCGNGMVTSDHKVKDVRRRIVEALESILDPKTGDSIVNGTLEREDIYQGPNVVDAPDITPIAKSDTDYFCQVYKYYENETNALTRNIKNFVDPESTGSAGDHSAHGILACSGPGVVKDRVLADASILDIAPTLAKILDVNHLSSWEGVTLHDLWGKDRPQAKKMGNRTPILESKDIMRNRLRSLGYRI